MMINMCRGDSKLERRKKKVKKKKSDWRFWTRRRDVLQHGAMNIREQATLWKSVHQ